jgi:hypothetical protein
VNELAFAHWLTILQQKPTAGGNSPVISKARHERSFVDDAHIEHVKLFDLVLAKTSLDKWVDENRGLSRTAVTDYRAGRIVGRVSAQKRAAIEAAIIASATALGLKP